MSVERSPAHLPIPADAQLGIGWAYAPDVKRLGVLIRWADGREHFSEGPFVRPGDLVELWVRGVLGIMVKHNEIDAADVEPLVEIARGFYEPRGLWST